jgi:hypothetical protein
MKYILIALALFPTICLANSDLDYAGIYTDCDLIVEGHLSDTIIKKIEVKTAPKDITTYIDTYLLVDGRVKFQRRSPWPYDEIEDEQGKRIARYRVIVPEWIYKDIEKLNDSSEMNTWFLYYSQIGSGFFTRVKLNPILAEKMIPDYMKGAIGQPENLKNKL